MEALVLCFLEPGYDNIEVVRALDRWPATRGRGAGGIGGRLPRLSAMAAQ
jgi:hypothetical protein